MALLVTRGGFRQRGLAVAWIAGLSALLLSNVSCNTDAYCLDCTDARVGAIDGSIVPLEDAQPSDGGPAPDACAVSGIEQCDGLDNDCDGDIDEGALPGVDDDCGSDTGECQRGKTACQDGKLICGDGVIKPTFEGCNNLDDDCDGNVDENNPGGGLICGTNLGECVAGVQECQNGNLVCTNQVTAGAETCNGLDDDCDGSFDENLTTAGNCGPTSDAGQCSFGTMTCVGGSMQCVGAVYPQVEQCDAFDRDCDGNPLNGYNLASDPFNCTGCGVVCSAPNAFMACDSGCVIAACEQGFIDSNGAVNDGCEFACNFQGNEICNGEDDDCDGSVDEDVVSPIACDPDGECAGTVPVCNSVIGTFECAYTGNVTLDGAGNIVAENDCDGLDNDCDGSVDEAFPSVGATCDDGELGECRDTGTVVCNAGGTGVECTANDDDGAPPAEVCNHRDDDCDGTIDEGDLQEWVDIGGVEIFKFEASRPDATALSQGFVTDASVCSSPTRLPWTNITQPEAEAVCVSIGASLCSEDVWQNACETDNLPGPNQQSGDNGLIVFEAEDTSFVANAAGSQESWEFTTDRAGFSGTGAMVVPSGQSSALNPNNLANAPRLTYTLNFVQTGTHYVWVRMLSDDNDQDSFYVTVDEVATNLNGDPYIDSNVHDSWLWFSRFQDGTLLSFDIATTGTHTLSFYHREAGVILDRVVVTSDPDFVPINQGPPSQCQWSYDQNCRDYQESTCNGEDFDGDPVAAGDQDTVLASGAMNSCYADWENAGDVFDLSGNVKEWTAERAPGVNPIRGGSFNNTAIGTSCQFDFLTADDNFFLPNIGFRCCR